MEGSIFLAFCMLSQRRQWQPTPVLLPGKSHGRRSLVGCSPWGHEESDMTERLHFHFSLSCIGEGNGNPLQCSCLENPRDGGAWWAAIYGGVQSWTRLKRLSSNSSTRLPLNYRDGSCVLLHIFGSPCGVFLVVVKRERCFPLRTLQMMPIIAPTPFISQNDLKAGMENL